MICKKRFLLFLMVAIFPPFANSQIDGKEMLHIAIGQYVTSMYDTTSKQVVYIEVIGEKAPHSLKYGDVMVSIFDVSKERHRLFSNAIRKANGYFHTLSIKRFGNDTVDFLFCKCRVNKSGKCFQIFIESGGDAGYLPFIRFVYNDMDKKWNYYSAQELMSEKRSNLILTD